MVKINISLLTLEIILRSCSLTLSPKFNAPKLKTWSSGRPISRFPIALTLRKSHMSTNIARRSNSRKIYPNKLKVFRSYFTWIKSLSSTSWPLSRTKYPKSYLFKTQIQTWSLERRWRCMTVLIAKHKISLKTTVELTIYAVKA